MKTVLKYSGIISAVLAIVAFILLLATPGVKYTTTQNVIGSSSSTTSIAGTVCIFGGTDAKYASTWAGLLAFILVVIALVILIAAIILPMLKVKALDKFAGVLNLVAVLSLICAGIFAFCIVAAFKAANGDVGFSIGNAVSATYSIGAGWVISGIILIAAGALAIAPTIADFVSKK